MAEVAVYLALAVYLGALGFALWRCPPEVVLDEDKDWDEYLSRMKEEGDGQGSVHPDERCLECGREMEMASPLGPLFCPDCQPDLDPRKED